MSIWTGYDSFNIRITYMNNYVLLDKGKQSAIEAFLILASILMISQLFTGEG